MCIICFSQTVSAESATISNPKSIYMNVCSISSKYSEPSNFERFDVRTTWNSNKKFDENPVLKLEQKLESRTTNHVVAFSLLGPDERRVIHLTVNSNIPPTIIIDWLLYNIFMYVLL
jgi:hypothetical protein